MENAEFVEALEISDVDGHQFIDSMDIHARRQPSIMDLHAVYVNLAQGLRKSS
jgi:hypothetical protein